MRNRFLEEGAVRMAKLSDSQEWYRARISNAGNGFRPNEMFHIPFEKRTDVVNYRFSITGYPCLYLGSSVLSCWAEMHCPALDNFVVSRIKVVPEVSISVLDLRIPDCNNKTCMQEDSERRYNNLMLLKTWPLIIACSIKTIAPASHFKYEYIHPQLLMLAIKEHYKDLCGVMYTSTHIEPTLELCVERYTNVAVPVNTIKKRGYCTKLKELFSISRGVPFIEAEIKRVFDLMNEISMDSITGEIFVSSYKNGAVPYPETKFGQLEEYLQNKSVELEKIE